MCVLCCLQLGFFMKVRIMNIDAIDLGAGGVDIKRFRFDGTTLLCEDEARSDHRPIALGGRTYWPHLQIWQNIQSGLREIAGRKGAPSSIGVDSWGVDALPVGSDGSPLTSLFSYRDALFDDKNLSQMMSQGGVDRGDMFMATGAQVMPINTLPQFYAMKKHGPKVLDRATRFMMVADLFHWALGAPLLNEVSNAITTQMYDQRGGVWAKEFVEKFGIPTRILGGLTAPGTEAGRVSDRLAADLGYQEAPAIVVPATHDTTSASAAVPHQELPCAQPESVVISSGSWNILFAELDAPLYSEAVLKYGFGNEGGVAGATRLTKNITGTELVRRCLEIWRRQKGTLDFSQLENMAENAAAFAALVDPDDPELLSGLDAPAAVNKVLQNSGQSQLNEWGEITRLLYEAMALKIAVRVKDCEDILNTKFRQVHLLGGGCKSRLLPQYIANSCGLPVLVGPEDATAYGNAMMQLVGLGKLASVQQGRQLILDSIQPMKVFPDESSRTWIEKCGELRELGSC